MARLTGILRIPGFPTNRRFPRSEEPKDFDDYKIPMVSTIPKIHMILMMQHVMMDLRISMISRIVRILGIPRLPRISIVRRM